MSVINGWAKNNDEISVEIEAQGNKEQIDKMIELIKKGNYKEIYCWRKNYFNNRWWILFLNKRLLKMFIMLIQFVKYY